MGKNPPERSRLDQVVAQARQATEGRLRSYRELALKLYPWICGRCGREFTRINLHELTVHHRNHNHEDNPPDGSNWELLCLYCHDNEHQRELEQRAGNGGSESERQHSTARPFAALAELLKKP
ncbi:MAG: YajD family HNH nuclease [Wenzhouxiangella sp.]